jgi:isopentenyldiphosphate isomerase
MVVQFTEVNRSKMQDSRVPLAFNGLLIGSLSEQVRFALCASQCAKWMQLESVDGITRYELDVPSLTGALVEIQHILALNGVAPQGGKEQVDVYHPNAQQTLGQVDRQLARILGLEMHSAHLLVFEGNQVWLQRRSLSKATDPGLWDTTVGGTRVAGETIDQTLEREMGEEAGLHPRQLTSMSNIGIYEFQRPSMYGVHAAYQNEKLWAWVAQVADPLWTPQCVDDEVIEFCLVSPSDAVRDSVEYPLTHEAATILADTKLRNYFASKSG